MVRMVATLGNNVEVDYFSDGRLKVLMRFKVGENFWYDPSNNTYTWCASIEELSKYMESLKAIDAYNKQKIQKKSNRAHS